MFLLQIFTLFMLASGAMAATPTTASIAYDLFRNGTHIAIINEHFEIKEGAYYATSEAKPIGLFALAQRRPVTYISTGESTKDGLRPIRFEGTRGSAVARVAFDWTTDTLTMNHDGISQTVALPHATQDRLSIMYQLTHLVQNVGQNKPRTVEFAMTTGRKLDRYRYNVQTDVLIDTPVKRLSTLHLVKQREQGDTQTEIWLAPEFHNLPVKVLIVESDGVRYEQIVTRLDVKL